LVEILKVLTRWGLIKVIAPAGSRTALLAQAQRRQEVVTAFRTQLPGVATRPASKSGGFKTG